MRLYPTLWVPRVQHITPQLLRQHGVRAVVLDIDNTLTTHNNPEIAPQVREWLGQMQQEGIRLILLSNNRDERVEPFARRLGLRYIANGAKPLRRGFARCQAELQLSREEIAVVGDQIFTDVLGGNRYGCVTILVDAIEPEQGWFFRLKRWLERAVLRGCRKEECGE